MPTTRHRRPVASVRRENSLQTVPNLIHSKYRLGSGKEKPVLTCVFFMTPAGTEPVREWIKGLDGEAQDQIGADILKVQWRWPLGKPLVDGFGDGLYEVRTTHDKIEFRVFFTVDEGVMVLLHGIQKTTRTTPAREIRIARKRLKDVSS